MDVVKLPVSQELEHALKRYELFQDTCKKIRIAWKAMGYPGDPILDLFSAIQGMSVFKL